MAVSMTGYGMNVLENDTLTVKVEMKSVNNRYLDINIRMPKNFYFLEETIKKQIRKQVKRGKVDVFIHLLKIESTQSKVHVDMDLAKSYHQALLQLKKTFGLKGRIRPYNLTNLNGLVTVEENLDGNTYKEPFLQATQKALEQMVDMKKQEGQALEKDMIDKVAHMKKHINIITEVAKEAPVTCKERLQSRLSELMEENDLPQERMLQEVAILADKACVDEEVIRLASHIDQFQATVKKSESGKKLDFIIQEMNREANTIGSKSCHLTISQQVVELKYMIEKLREQAQNIE